jgi:hypothetical protein
MSGFEVVIARFWWGQKIKRRVHLWNGIVYVCIRVYLILW